MITKTYNNAETKKILKATEEYDFEGKPKRTLVAERVSCRRMSIHKLVQTSTGTEVIAKTEVWLPEEIGLLPVESKIIFSDNEEGVVVESYFVNTLVGREMLKVFLR